MPHVKRHSQNCHFLLVASLKYFSSFLHWILDCCTAISSSTIYISLSLSSRFNRISATCFTLFLTRQVIAYRRVLWESSEEYARDILTRKSVDHWFSLFFVLASLSRATVITLRWQVAYKSRCSTMTMSKTAALTSICGGKSNFSASLSLNVTCNPVLGSEIHVCVCICVSKLSVLS